MTKLDDKDSEMKKEGEEKKAACKAEDPEVQSLIPRNTNVVLNRTQIMYNIKHGNDD